MGHRRWRYSTFSASACLPGRCSWGKNCQKFLEHTCSWAVLRMSQSSLGEKGGCGPLVAQSLETREASSCVRDACSLGWGLDSGYYWSTPIASSLEKPWLPLVLAQMEGSQWDVCPIADAGGQRMLNEHELEHLPKSVPSQRDAERGRRGILALTAFHDPTLLLRRPPACLPVCFPSLCLFV